MYRTIKILIFLFIILCGSFTIFQHKLITKYKNENIRLQNNINNLDYQLHNIIDKNGETHNYVNSLNLKASELEKINSSLNNELKNMNLKIKNLQDASKIIVKYKYKTDTVETIKELNTKNKWNSSFKNNYINANWQSQIDTLNNLKVKNFNVALNDTILTASEIIYKGWWFWRKPKEIRIHIKSKNPYINIDKFESIKFTK